MSLDYPSFDDFVALSQAEFKRQIPTIDPTVFGSWSRAFNESTAATAAALSLVLRDLEKQLFPQTAEGEFLDRWGNYENLERNPPSQAQGLVSIIGTPGTSVAAGKEFRSSNGNVYETINNTSVTTVTQVISSLTAVMASGTVTVTAVTSTNHNLATGMTLTVLSADQTEYNVTTSIAVTAGNEFQYTIDVMPPASPATGTISYESDFVSALVRSQETGDGTNAQPGAALTAIDTQSGLTGEAFAQFEGITGGSNIETDDEYRQRILLSRSTIEGVFTKDQVQLAALSITGNTRAFVIRATDIASAGPPVAGTPPAPGQTIVYILRDNDDNIIPSQTLLDETKAAIISLGALPAHMSENDLGVFAPTLVTTDFTFTALTPDTTTMRQAVQDQLAAFFEDQVEFEQDVNQNTYLAAIQNTTDQQTGDLLQSFTLSAPAGNITVNDGEIAALGDVTFSI